MQEIEITFQNYIFSLSTNNCSLDYQFLVWGPNLTYRSVSHIRSEKSIITLKYRDWKRNYIPQKKSFRSPLLRTNFFSSPIFGIHFLFPSLYLGNNLFSGVVTIFLHIYYLIVIDVSHLIKFLEFSLDTYHFLF